MEKLRVVVLTDSMDARVHLRDLLTAEDIALSGFAGFDETALQKVMGLSPDAVVCGAAGESSGLFEIAQNIYCRLKSCAVVLVSPDASMELANRAMRAGIRQVLPWDISEKELQESIRRVCVLERQRFSEVAAAQKRRCRTLGFFSGKGGTGKTTMAVNCAVALAQKGVKVILIDCDLQFGDVSLHLDLDPKETLQELAQEEAALSADLINGYIQLHGTGLNVLCAPKSPEFADYVTGRHIETIVDTLRPYYEFIVLDFPPSFNDVSIAGLENCDQIFLVYNMDISSLKNAKTCVNILDSLKQKDKVRVVLNKFTKGMIRLRDYETTLDLKVLGTVSLDAKSAVGSLDRGFPLVSALPRVTISREIKNIAYKIANNTL